ncbi:hypothetical protein HAX54_016216, partial [Datura stramonium]|nr:hypothetical protein [Datura stramonium]
MFSLLTAALLLVQLLIQESNLCCIDIHNINFPFRLKADPSNCGDSRFQLDCQNSRTVISLNSRNYNVLEINYDKFLIRAIDPTRVLSQILLRAIVMLPWIWLRVAALKKVGWALARGLSWEKNVRRVNSPVLLKAMALVAAAAATMTDPLTSL